MTTAATMTAPALEQIELARLIPTPENPRTVSEDDPRTLSLAESIKANGVRVPVSCRPHPTEKGAYDLRAGHRRLVAAKLAGLKTIPAVVREMSDDEAMLETIIENDEREPLTPIEEARSIRTMMDGHGWSIAQVAEQLGRSVQTIARRANLLNLTRMWQEEMEDEENRDWPIASWELIARLPAEVQDRLLTEHRGWDVLEAGRKPKELQGVLNAYLHLLKSAMWSLGDEDLVPAAGPCTSCPKRSSCQPDLFDDQDDQCLDSECWAAKAAAVIQRKVDDLRTKHPEAIVVRRGGVYEPGLDAFSSIRDWETTPAKKGQEGAVPALLIGGGKQPSAAWVKLNGSGSGGGGRQPGQKKTLRERLAALEKRRQKRAVELFQELIEEATKADGLVDLDAQDLTPYIQLSLAFGISEFSWTDPSPIKKSAEADRGLGALLAAGWGEDRLGVEFKKRVLRAVLKALPKWDVEGNWKRVVEVCNALNIDSDAFMVKAEAGIKTPKSILQEQAQAELDAKAKAEKPAAKKGAKGRKPTPAEVERGYDIHGQPVDAEGNRLPPVKRAAKKAGKGKAKS